MPKLGFCPFTLALFIGSVALGITLVQEEKKKKKGKQDSGSTTTGTSKKKDRLQVVFVLGGPGSGKGTQCDLLTKRLPGPWVHLSAGDLLRAERKRAQTSTLGALIEERISNGQLVPSTVTCRLIQNAMEENQKTKGITKFLVDGYPRGLENKTVWEQQVENATIEFVLFLDCPEEVLTGRLLERGQSSGRSDDANIDVIRKRFRTYQNETAPIVQEYERQGKVVRIPADRPVEEVYESIATAFQSID
jgi:UMP-CMP kinase